MKGSSDLTLFSTYVYHTIARCLFLAKVSADRSEDNSSGSSSNSNSNSQQNSSHTSPQHNSSLVAATTPPSVIDGEDNAELSVAVEDSKPTAAFAIGVGDSSSELADTDGAIVLDENRSNHTTESSVHGDSSDSIHLANKDEASININANDLNGGVTHKLVVVNGASVAASQNGVTLHSHLNGKDKR